MVLSEGGIPSQNAHNMLKLRVFSQGLCPSHNFRLRALIANACSRRLHCSNRNMSRMSALDRNGQTRATWSSPTSVGEDQHSYPHFCLETAEQTDEERPAPQPPFSGHCSAISCLAVIEIMFGRLKDWRRMATRCDQCPSFFLSAIALAAPSVYWL